MKKISFVLFMVGILVFISCGKKKEEPVAQETTAFQEVEHLTVQHILISFQGAPRMTDVTRTLEEARELAKEILKRAKDGEDFDALVKEYTDDQHPGIYKMANTDVTPDREGGESSRGRMVKAFGDVSFSLSVGEIGMTEYSPETSMYGWHIIKRLE
ncbi:MAG: peptidyl-prolyl cis-trans isomerase [Candidatus Aminicenantes bacterium]|nr:peptidyl-prolyl cis-trans isomerase [Candidatus Aminicenantes bacterium]